MIRRGLVLLLIATAALPAAIAQGRERSPRLHAFRSCTNLLTYAQRHAVRVIGDPGLFRAGGRDDVVMPLSGSDERGDLSLIHI